MTFYIWGFSENLSRKFKLYCNLTRKTGTWREEICKCMTISRWILLRIINVSDKACRENQNTFYVQYFFSENRAVYNKKYGRIRHATDDNIMLRRKVRFALRITQARLQTRTHVIYHIYCFSKATGVTQSRLNVTFYVHCLSCYLYKNVTVHLLETNSFEVFIKPSSSQRSAANVST
jgi:hypothetical protein